MQLQELINITNKLFYNDSPSYKTITSKQNELLRVMSSPVHGAILFDGIGFGGKEILDKLQIPVINILVDHPMTFGHCMQSPPQKYIQFSPDEYHVKFAKRFYNIENKITADNSSYNIIHIMLYQKIKKSSYTLCKKKNR